MKGFVKHLDKYTDTQMVLQDYYILLNDINMNYYQHKLGPTIYTPTTPPMTPRNPFASCQKVYPSPEIKKIHKSIDVSIDSLKDLIKLIDENPYDTTYEYNIDLEGLHKIRGELCQIDNMIGLHSLKQSILDQLLYFLQNLHKGSDGDFKHTVLMGPPGTGKTEIAKIIGNMYSKIGVLSNSVFKKVTRTDLVAGYLGQTAIKTQKVIESCLGGVLFIDEAYALGEPNKSDMYSKECLDTICEALSDHKDNLMVIIAGYEDALKECFFNMNSGLESRFIWRFTMDPYSTKELTEILEKKIKESGWTYLSIKPEENTIPHNWFETKKQHFQNYGRDIEALFTYSKIAHSRRIYGKSFQERKSLTIEDLDKGYSEFVKHKQIKKSVFYDMYL
jgi:SpoVK/Ycf46/Vps4 family AAA+-type ATPase